MVQPINRIFNKVNKSLFFMSFLLCNKFSEQYKFIYEGGNKNY